MRTISKCQHEDRVAAVLDIIRAITGGELVSEAYVGKLNAMSYEELGTLVMKIVKTRSVEEILGLDDTSELSYNY
jgi:hypothetical protein